jgi:hypothetical protein
MNTITTTTARPDPAHDDAHDLMPAWLAAELPKLYSTEHEKDPTVRCKWFTPDSSWTWYVTEYDPVERLAFGLVDGFEQELGYIALDELEQVRGPLGLRVERDLWFPPTPLSALRSPGAKAGTP